MPSSRQPANSGRRAQHDSTDQSPPSEAVRELSSVLSKITAERDRYAAQLAKAVEKRDEQDRQVLAAKDQARRYSAELARVKDELAQAKEELKELGYQNLTLDKENIRLTASYESLQIKFNALPAPDRKNPMTAVSDRTKRTATSSTSSGSNTGASKHEVERGRAREKEKERAQKAEKERLSTRFDRRPPASGRRASFVEPRRSSSTAPSVRRFDPVARSGRYEEPLISPRDAPVFSTPRTVPVPAPSSGYHSGSSAVYDENEDGYYHAHPIR